MRYGYHYGSRRDGMLCPKAKSLPEPEKIAPPVLFRAERIEHHHHHVPTAAMFLLIKSRMLLYRLGSHCRV